MKTKGPAIAGARASWTPLLDWPQENISRGTVFRCLKAEWPYEPVVDFMVLDQPDSPSSFALVVVTGYKAGLTLVQLPAEAQALNVRALSTEWVVKNWSKWVYPECPVALVQVLENYPAEVRIEGAMPAPSRDLKLS